MPFNFTDFKKNGGKLHFIGCAGAGTGPLAAICLELGFPCSGSDMISSELTDSLQKKGLVFHQGHTAKNLPEGNASNLLVIHTSAAAPDNPELAEAHKRGILCMKRGEALAHLGTLFPHTIAVAGSHGKTSVTALTVHILKEIGLNPGYLIGGIVHDSQISGTAGDKKLFVTEVDESDSTNALFHAETAVVTNVEDDHSWSVGGRKALFESFVKFARQSKKLLYVSGANPDRLFDGMNAVRLRSDEWKNFPGWQANWGGFQKQNAYTAIRAVSLALGGLYPEIELFRASLSFPGVERRLSLRFDSPSYRIIEDYAHHPTELKASLNALAETNPNRRLIVIFQPHRYARLKKYLNEFATILKSTQNPVFLAPVFAAWSDRSDTDSGTLAEKIGANAHLLSGSWEDQAEQAAKKIRPGDLIAVIGAGDVKEIIEPLRKRIE